MRKRHICFMLCMVSFLFLVVCGHSGGDNKAPVQEVMSLPETKIQKDAGNNSGEQMVIENDSTGQEVRRLELTSVLNEQLADEDDPGKAAFVEWLINTYGSERLESIDFSGDFSRQLYDITGKSLRVLWDTSLGYIENPDIAARHSIYLREAKSDGVDMAFAGDLCLTEDGYVIDHYDELGGNLDSCLSEKIVNRLNRADISMLNHEYSTSRRGKALEGKYYTFRAAPKREKILQELGIDIVSIANNHIYDFGEDAFLDTLDALKQIGIPGVGAGTDRKEASKPVYFVVGGMKIGFVAANCSEKYILTPEAQKNSPGVMRMYDTAKMNVVIQKARKQCDYLIAYVHWGTENSKYYETYQTEIAKEFFDSGADAIIGSHPHVLQGIGYVDGKPIVYSLGDFWFNGESKYTTIVNFKVTMDGLAELSVLPCMQRGYETHYISKKSKQKAFYAYLQKLSPEAAISEQGNVTEN